MTGFPRELWAMFVDCPADELAPCYFYEYSRESKSLREACANSRPVIPSGVANGFDFYLSNPWSGAQEELMTDPARTFMLWPEWPDKPYLEIPPEERRRRLRWSAKDDPKIAHLKKLSFFAMTQLSPEGLRPVSPAGATAPSGESWSEALAHSQGKLGWPVHQINPSRCETHVKQLGALRISRKFKDDEIPPHIAIYEDKSEGARAKLVAEEVIEWFSV